MQTTNSLVEISAGLFEISKGLVNSSEGSSSILESTSDRRNHRPVKIGFLIFKTALVAFIPALVPFYSAVASFIIAVMVLTPHIYFFSALVLLFCIDIDYSFMSERTSWCNKKLCTRIDCTDVAFPSCLSWVIR